MWMIIEATEYEGGGVHIFMSREDALNWHESSNWDHDAGRVLVPYNGEFETLNGQLEATFHEFPDGAYDFGGVTYYYESGCLRARVDSRGDTNYFKPDGGWDSPAIVKADGTRLFLINHKFVRENEK